MPAPRWFYPVVAAAIVIAAAAFTYHNTAGADVWTMKESGDAVGAFNGKTGEFCGFINGGHVCVNLVTGKRADAGQRAPVDSLEQRLRARVNERR